MRKFACFLFATISLYTLLVVQGFAEENNSPTYVNVNSVIKPVTFGPDKTAKIEIPTDNVNKTILISLPPGSTKDILLLSCNNQHVTSSQSATCPFSTTLTLVDYSSTTQKETDKNILEGAMIGAAIGVTIFAIITNSWVAVAYTAVGSFVGAFVWPTIKA